MENNFVHTPFQKVQKLRQFISHPISWITAKLWCESHNLLPIWCITFPYMIWSLKYYHISGTLAYGAAKTKASVTPWGYRARLGKIWATGKTDECKNMNDKWNIDMNHKCLEHIQKCLISFQIWLRSWITNHWKIGKTSTHVR